MTTKQRPPWRTGREVIEIASQSLGMVTLIFGLFVWLPIGPAMVITGAMLLALGIAYEVSGGDQRGTREDVPSDGTAY